MAEKPDYEGDDPSGCRYYLVKNGMYYRPESKGYTSSLMEAGLFGERYAQDHVASTVGVTMLLAF